MTTVRYRRIAADIRRRIAEGEWPPGQYIPSVRALSAEYVAGTGVIQAAIRLLSSQGWVDTEPYVGVLVADPLPAAWVTVEELAAKLAALEARVARGDHPHSGAEGADFPSEY